MEEAKNGGGAGTAAGTAVPPEVAEKKTMNILVAIDDSDESFHALQWALDKILKHTPVDEVITIVNVVEPLPRYAFPGGYVVESTSKAQEQNAGRIVSRALEMCKDASSKVKTLIVEGDPKDRICRAVEEMSIDLLVVGSHGLGQIKRALLGSVSDYCTHHAKCPVLVVKPPPKRTSSDASRKEK